MDTQSKLKKEIKISTYRQEGTKRIYSNHVEVAISANDVSFKFSDLVPPTGEEIEQLLKENEIKIPVLAEVVLTHKVAKAFLEVLNKQLEKVEKKGNKT